jgi:polyhydroxybutyrate depolymerase
VARVQPGATGDAHTGRVSPRNPSVRGRLPLLLGCCAALVAGCAVGGPASTPGPATTPASTATSAPGTTTAPAATSAPATTTGPATTTAVRTVESGGTERSYLVIAPAGRRAPLPLLVVLHGRNVTAQTEAVRTGFEPLAERGAAVLAYPIGIGASWNAGGGCCGEAATEGVDDSAFVDAVAADAARHLPVDPARVYLVGYSNGGKLAFRVVCDHPGVFAAFATYGAVPLAPCGSTAPLPAMVAAGADDPELAAADPPRTVDHAVADAAAVWRARDGCAPAATTATIGPAAVTTWSDCRAGTAVESAMYAGLNHYWPVAAPVPVEFSTAVGDRAAAATLMWEFLSGHRRA